MFFVKKKHCVQQSKCYVNTCLSFFNHRPSYLFITGWSPLWLRIPTFYSIQVIYGNLSKTFKVHRYVNWKNVCSSSRNVNAPSEMTFHDFISIFADQNKASLFHHLFLHPEFHLHRDVLGKKPKKKLRGVSLRRFET